MPNETKQQFKISSFERRAAASLGGIFALRMLGLFMILPVFSLYAHQLTGFTPMLMGIAIGAYGLTQAFLQIPFGLLSDRIGRKKVIIIGLLIFAAGGALAAVSHSIYGVIAGRALQGAGAIAAAIMALLADLTRVETRTKAMAILGGSIGMSFTLALLLGPILNGIIGVPGIFWLTSVLALIGILVVLYIVPQPVDSHFHTDTEPVLAQFGTILKNTQLLRLDFGIFSLHLLITATFVALPLLLRDTLQMPAEHHWWIYLPVLLLAVLAMFPFIIIAERYGKAKAVFLGAICILVLAELGLSLFHQQIYQVVVMLFLFFAGFNLMEATLPSLISKLAPPNSKGTAMGVYSSSQFLGAFVGGATGGWLLGLYGPGGVFAGAAIAAFAWLLVALNMQAPQVKNKTAIDVTTTTAHP
ncbi:MAG TPA: MFS transporter [Gammaproteobacteria bacterium]|nr:MFS transporter [Gammaproteobacteria bacterium]